MRQKIDNDNGNKELITNYYSDIGNGKITGQMTIFDHHQDPDELHLFVSLKDRQTQEQINKVLKQFDKIVASMKKI